MAFAEEELPSVKYKLFVVRCRFFKVAVAWYGWLRLSDVGWAMVEIRVKVRVRV